MPISRASRFKATPSVPSGKREQLVRHGARQTLDDRDAVSRSPTTTPTSSRDASGVYVDDVPFDGAADLVGGNRQLCHLLILSRTSESSSSGRRHVRSASHRVARGASRVETVPSITSSPMRIIKPPRTAGSTAVWTEMRRRKYSLSTALSRLS